MSNIAEDFERRANSFEYISPHGIPSCCVIAIDIAERGPVANQIAMEKAGLDPVVAKKRALELDSLLEH